MQDNVSVSVNTMPKTDKENTRRGRPRKTKVAEDIDEAIKELLSDFEISEGGDEDLFYNVDEVNKENDGMANQLDKVDCNIGEKGAKIGDQESDDESDGLASLQGNDCDDVERKKKCYKQFNEKHDLKISMTFDIVDQFVDTYFFKRALKTYAVQNEFDYNYKHNNISGVSAVCRERHCAWRIHAFIDATRTCIRIKTFYPTHICGNQYENTIYDVEYLVRMYKKDFEDDPTWTLYTLQQRVKRDLNIDVPIACYYRAKNEGLHQLFGSHSKQYCLTRGCASALLRINPSSKKGFKYGCWPIICLDACHLNREYEEQLLCATGKDDNDDMFSIAFTMAEAVTPPKLALANLVESLVIYQFKPTCD